MLSADRFCWLCTRKLLGVLCGINLLVAREEGRCGAFDRRVLLAVREGGVQEGSQQDVPVICTRRKRLACVLQD